MNGASRIKVLIIALLMAPVIAHAQGNVLVVLTQPPPNQLRISDLWKVDLTNTTNQAVTVYLRGYADEEVEGRIVDARSRDFTIPANARIRVTGTMLEPITVDQWHPGFKTIILRTGELPTGKYHVCVEVYQVSDRTIIGTDCFDQDVELEKLTPPMLVFPLDESNVSDRLPIFSWLPPTPMRRGESMTYQLRIVEILGRQTPYDALSSNPAFFDMREIAANQYRFPLGARGFQVGRTYAWQVRAFLAQRFGDRIPMGESEIWWFSYGSVNDPDIDDEGTEKLTDLKQTPPVRTPVDDIEPLDVNQPKIGRTNTPVARDLTLKSGFIPPNLNLNDLAFVKPEVVLSPSLLRALLHTCQGED